MNSTIAMLSALIVFGLIAVFIFRYIKNFKINQLQNLAQNAQQLGLTFYGADTLPPEYVEIIRDNARDNEATPLLALTGTYNSVSVLISTTVRQMTRRNKIFMTYYYGQFKNPLPARCYITTAGTLMRMVGKALGVGGVEVGDPELEKKYHFTGENPQAMREFMSRPEVQISFDELTKKHAAVITWTGVLITQTKNLAASNMNELQETLTALTDAVRQMKQ